MSLFQTTTLVGAISLTVFGGACASTISQPGFHGAPLPVVREGEFEEGYVARTLAPLRTADTGQNGLDRGDVLRERTRAETRRRAGAISRVLTFDTDGDQRVTREEAATTDLDFGRSSDIWKYDTNTDGVITLKEVTALVAEEVAVDDQLAALLTLDPDKDDVLTSDELEHLARETFARIDTDRNGQISRPEHQVHRQAAEFAAAAKRCSMPAPAPRARIVAVGSYDAEGVSDVTVVGQAENMGAASVFIEPGPEPLYLIFASYEPIVWRLEGNTRRVSQVVLSAHEGLDTGQSGSAVAGIDRHKVSVLPRDCIGYFYPGQKPEDTTPRGSDSVERVRRQIEASVGRPPDAVVGSHDFVRISVPSGAVEERWSGPPAPPPPGFDADTWREATRFYPQGVTSFDPRQVVGAAPAERYEVLPQQFGLAQLVGSGHLQRTGGSRFRVVKKIPRFPSGLFGAHSAHFVVAPGVPTPEGGAGHSCVVFEDERRPLGFTCHGR